MVLDCLFRGSVIEYYQIQKCWFHKILENSNSRNIWKWINDSKNKLKIVLNCLQEAGTIEKKKKCCCQWQWQWPLGEHRITNYRGATHIHTHSYRVFKKYQKSIV